MSDFTMSLSEEGDDEVKRFVLALFDRVNDLHSSAETELEQAYHQGEKDALRRVLAVMTGRDIDMVIPTSVIAYKLRGEIPLDDGSVIKKKDQQRSKYEPD